jgi:hypothetical protein
VASLALENHDGYERKPLPCVRVFFVGIRELIAHFVRAAKYFINRFVPKNLLLFGLKVQTI